jgi:hypothetical protein
LPLFIPWEISGQKIEKMSVWRKRAMDYFPELKREFEQADMTPCGLFIEILPLCRKAHLDNHVEQLEKIYAYAEWCFRQNDKSLLNAAGVCFYEHLPDQDMTLQTFMSWIKKDIYFDIRGLLILRLNQEKMDQLDEYYGWKNQTKKNKK